MAAAETLAVKRLNQGIDRAIRLVEQLLNLARAQASGDAAVLAGGVETQRVDLGQIVRLAAGDALPRAQHAGIALGLGDGAAEPERPPGPERRAPIEVRGDADALHALVANLLDNAIKYTPAPGRVEVDLVRRADGVLFERRRQRARDRTRRARPRVRPLLPRQRCDRERQRPGIGDRESDRGPP